MSNFYFILFNVITPIFIQIIIGYIVQKWIHIDVKVLSKVQFYFFIPSFIFLKLGTTIVPGDIFFRFICMSAVLMIITWFLATIISVALGHSKSMKAAFVNSNVFFNSGNLCIPLVDLLYTDPIAITTQLCIFIFQNVANNSIGIINAVKGKSGIINALVSILKMPLIYAVIAGILVRHFNIEVWAPLKSALQLSSGGLVPLALFTLGAQLASTKFNFKLKSPIIAAFMRLIMGPVIAYALIKLLGITGIPAQVFVICASAPTAVNTALLALQFNNEPDFASQTVLISTILSTFTMTAIIYLAMNYIK